MQELYKSLEQEFPVISDQSILGDVRINKERYPCQGLLFKNCEFEGELKFDAVDLKLGVRFTDCVFKKNLVFANVTATGIKDLFNDDNVSIFFKNCVHDKALIIVNSEFERAIRIEQQQGMEDLTISKTKAHSIDFFESKLGGLDIEYVGTKIGFRIEKSEVSGQGRYFGCEGGGFTFMGSGFKRDQSLWANKVQSISTNDGVFEEEFKIKACPADSYTLYGTEFKKGVTIMTLDNDNHINAVIKSLYVKNCDFKGGLSFTGHKQIAGLANCEKLMIICSNLLTGNLTFENSVIIQLDIQGTNTVASISFQKCDFKTVHIDHFINQGKLYFGDMESYDRTGSVFSVAKTSLGSAIFLNVNLLHFESVIIKHSHLTDIVFTDVKWFTRAQLNPAATFNDDVSVDEIYHFRKGKIDYRLWALLKTNKEVYRQLKYAALRLGDSVQSLVFQGQEMKLYKRELAFYRPDKNYIGNKVMMWLNQSNNYGNDWIKPVWILLLVNVFFYVMITILQSGRFHLFPSFLDKDVQATGTLLTSHFDAYWSLLNPIRKLSDLFPEKKSFSAWTVFWDYFDRIAVSYFIFQIVSAFRKYTKGA